MRQLCAGLGLGFSLVLRPRLGKQSENKLQGQLHVEWLTRTDTRRAIVVADGVGALAKSAEEVAARRRKVQALEDIEHFHAELSFQGLGHRNILEYREVYRSKAQTPITFTLLIALITFSFGSILNFLAQLCRSFVVDRW